MEWLNSQPLTLAELQANGQSTLIVFWTFSCVNCLRTLPTLKRWWEAYQHQGLVVLGIHSPEFGFEKQTTNLQRATQELKITWPVLNDAEHNTWNAYHNHYWPRHILVNNQGRVVYDHIGEGDYKTAEQAIQQLLIQHGATQLPTIPHDKHHHKVGTVCYAASPETYLGSARGILKKSNSPHRPGIYLHGEWDIQTESAIHTRSGIANGDYASLVFSATEVNLVAGTTDQRMIEAVVSLNGRPISAEQRGPDIIDQSGKTMVRILESRLYRLVRSSNYLSPAELRITDESGRLVLYAFTFSGCQED